MKKYTIDLVEKHYFEVEVMAENEEQAIELACEKYDCANPFAVDTEIINIEIEN